MHSIVGPIPVAPIMGLFPNHDHYRLERVAAITYHSHLGKTVYVSYLAGDCRK